MTWVLRDSCPGPQVTSGSVCLPCPRPSRARAPPWRPEPPWPGAHRCVPAVPARAGRMDTLEAARQRLRPAGGVRRVDRAGAGSAGASSSARAAAGRARPGRGQPPAFAPVASRGEAEERRREAGWAVSGRRARLPLPAPRGRPAGRPPAQPRGAPANSCWEPTAAPAGAPARTCPGEVRPGLPHRASGLGKTASSAGELVWSRPQARWSQDLILGLRGLGK